MSVVCMYIHRKASAELLVLLSDKVTVQSRSYFFAGVLSVPSMSCTSCG